MAWQTSDTVMKYRERYRVVDVVVEMLDGWRRHQSSKDAWLLAFFTFLSIFPLLLAGVTILGIVLDGNDNLQDRIVNSALAEIPVLGGELINSPDAISGGFWSVVLGLGGALWSSGKAFVGLQTGLDDTWDVPLDDRAGLPQQRGKALLGVAIIGGSAIGSVAINTIITAADFPVIGDLALTVATFGVNIAVIAAMYRWLTSHDATWGEVWPGAAIAGVVITLLQRFGTELISRFAGVENSEELAAQAAASGGDTRQIITLIIGVITWLSLVGITVMMCAELNAALKRLGSGQHVQRGPEMSIAIRN